MRALAAVVASDDFEDFPIAENVEGFVTRVMDFAHEGGVEVVGGG